VKRCNRECPDGVWPVLERFKKRMRPAAQPATAPRFYQVSDTCQIPDLPVFYEQYFGRFKTGCFVEVGAFDGEFASNTCGLADMGWLGYYIEPVPVFFSKCSVRHAGNPATTVSQIAIGAESKTITLQIAGPLTTSSKQMADNFRSLEWAKDMYENSTSIEVQQIALEEYLTEHGVTPGFHVLVIDVEGAEWDVLRNFDLSRWRPQMVLIELHDQNPDYFLIRKECNNIVEYFHGHEYKVISKDLTNTIYVPKDRFPLALNTEREDGSS
jgi:FkbM family methyltransferase